MGIRELFEALHLRGNICAFEAQFPNATDEQLKAVMAYIMYEKYRVKPSTKHSILDYASILSVNPVMSSTTV